MPHQPFYGLWIGVAVEFLCVLPMSRHGNFLERGESGRFAALAAVTGMRFFFAVRGLQKTAAPAGSVARWFWIVAVVLRVAALPTFPSDGFWRYRWKRNVQLHGFNPYQLPLDSAARLGSMRRTSIRKYLCSTSCTHALERVVCNLLVGIQQTLVHLGTMLLCLQPHTSAPPQELPAPAVQA